MDIILIALWFAIGAVAGAVLSRGSIVRHFRSAARMCPNCDHITRHHACPECMNKTWTAAQWAGQACTCPECITAGESL